MKKIKILTKKHKQNLSDSLKGRTPWNKGLTSKADKRVKKNCEVAHKTLKKRYKSGKLKIWNKGKTKENNKGIRNISNSKLGEKNPSWKGGIHKHSNGYIMIRQPQHPKANSNGYVFEHILVMEKKIGRYLRKKEIVHHINNKRDDNRIENLRLFKSQKEHMIFHNLKLVSDDQIILELKQRGYKISGGKDAK